MNAKLKKSTQIESLSSLYKDHSLYVFLFDFSFVNAKLNFQIRKDLFTKANLKVTVVKNTVNRAAFKNSGFNIPEEFLKGQNAMVISKDPIMVANILSNYVFSGLKFKIFCSFNKSYNLDYFKYISRMEDISSLYSSLLGMMTSPMSRLLSVLKQKSPDNQNLESDS